MVAGRRRQAADPQLLAGTRTHRGLGLLDGSDTRAPELDPLIVTLVPAVEMDECGLVLLVDVHHAGRVPLPLAVLGRHLGPELRNGQRRTHSAAAARSQHRHKATVILPHSPSSA